MKFIADVMLGRLAKRLRLLGFDVLYDRTFDDNEIIRLSLEQHRVILTRDTGLTQRPLASNHLFIKNQTVDKQLDEVFSAFPETQTVRPLTRCSECNAPLVEISKAEAKDLVPQHVYQSQQSFLQCGQCGRVYWPGTHVNRMKLK
jgi:hypothetical protein